MAELFIQSAVRITSDQVWVDGEKISIKKEEEVSWLTNIYRNLDIQYPKFFKMDNLCKAGFLAAEMLMGKSGLEPTEEKRDWSVLLFNRSSSLDNDQSYQQTIADSANYFPSPAVFVYTLSNIVTGEIAIRNKIMGESCSYIMDNFDADILYETGLIGLSEGKGIDHLLIGWVEFLDDTCDVLLFHVTKEKNGKTICPWNNVGIKKFFL
ncbi:MAG: hypothetical protein MJZ34_00095 [Paludibacteraceae bacterium]|nr:hypothetical protein [Paludibacteraceae bacterium]